MIRFSSTWAGSSFLRDTGAHRILAGYPVVPSLPPHGHKFARHCSDRFGKTRGDFGRDLRAASSPVSAARLRSISAGLLFLPWVTAFPCPWLKLAARSKLDAFDRNGFTVWLLGRLARGCGGFRAPVSDGNPGSWNSFCKWFILVQVRGLCGGGIAPRFVEVFRIDEDECN